MREQSREEQVELLSFCRRSMAGIWEEKERKRKRRKRRKEGEKEKKLCSETLELKSTRKKRKSA